MLSRITLGALAALALVSGLRAETVDLDPQLEKIRAVGLKGEGHREATKAWRTVAKAEIEQLPQILGGMKGAGLLASNWIRAAAEVVAQNGLKKGEPFPKKQLEAFLVDTSQAPRGRRLAFELLKSQDPTVEQRIIPTLRNDPSLELRRDAIRMALRDAKASLTSNKKAAVVAYREALSSARDVDQIKEAASQLKSLGVKTDLPSHFGFIMKWSLIAPFDNREDVGYDKAYPPEKEIDLTATYEGLEQKVKWTTHTTENEFGVVDLNKAIGKHMGAVGYAYTRFISDRPRDAELRIGCINSNKVWLNGKLVTANHVYHAGTAIDQYVGKVRLKEGENKILVKICQNEQTDNWAQRWQFQLRICDSLGTAILSQDRVSPRTTQLPRTVR